MATRNRVQRGEDAKALGTFEGRVRKWRKQWLTAGPTREGQRLKFNVWTAMEERSAGHVPRSGMVAVENPRSKPPMPRFAAPPQDLKQHKRGRPSMSGMVTEDRSLTPAVSEGVSMGVTQKTEGTSAPKIIRFKLKSSATLANAGTSAPAAGAVGGTPPSMGGAAAPSPGDAAGPSVAAGQAGGGGPTPIRIKLEHPGPAQQPIKQEAQQVGAAMAPMQQQQGAAVAAVATTTRPAATTTTARLPSAEPSSAAGDGAEVDELAGLQPQEPTSPRSLDVLIPDLAAAARHDATAVLLGGLGTGGHEAPGQEQPVAAQVPPS